MTFDVEVTEVVIPEEYTRYDWVATKDDTGPDNKVPSYFIYLNAYEDMNLLSSEFILGEKPNVQRANSGVCGARLASGDGYHWYGLYMQDDGVRVDLRAGGSKVAYPVDRHRFKLVVDNPPTSPCSATIIDGEATTTRVWTSSPVIPYAMSLFNNIPNGATSKMAFNFSTRIGDIIFRDYEGRCVGFYVPVTYQGKIGMFDVITQTFCTAKTTSAVTISNSGCLYKVGNW